MDPCGTPSRMQRRLLEVPFIETNCCLLRRQPSNHFSSVPWIPSFLSFLSKITWSTVSNALRRSQSPQLQVHNLSASFPQIFDIFSAVEQQETIYFFATRCFLLLRGFKGTVARDFRPQKYVQRGMIPQIQGMNQESIWGRFMRRKKIRGQKSRATVPFKASFWFPQKQAILKLFLVDF